MEKKKLTAHELLTALHEDTLERPGFEIVGMVKKSEKPGYVAFTQKGCGAWADLPIELIRDAEEIGWSPCKDHAHTLMRIRLKEPTSPEAQLYFALLSQSQSVREGLLSPIEALENGRFGPEGVDPLYQSSTRSGLRPVGFATRPGKGVPPFPPPWEMCRIDYYDCLAYCQLLGEGGRGTCACRCLQRRCLCMNAIGWHCDTAPCPIGDPGSGGN
jgi:hypothetical protein